MSGRGRQSPPLAVLRAYGVEDAELEPLAGGQGGSWRAGGIVLKPLELGAAEIEWQAGLFDRVRFEGVRVPRVARTRAGEAVVDGWSAWEHVAGEYVEGRWGERVAAGEAFHRALAGEPRPDRVIDERTDHWATGDRVAWGELPVGDWLHVKHVPRLAAALRPVDASSQLVHGDLGSNVLLADGLEPAVIDFSPYFRPPAFASAVIVGDALIWEDADETVLDAVAHVDDFPQYLLRALIYRAVTDRLARPHEPVRRDEDDHYLPAVELALRLAA